MENIYYLLLLSLCCWYFVFLRKVAESARKYVTQYCQEKDLQYLSIARLSSRLRFNKKHGVFWLSRFEFEFSGDRESQYTGQVILSNYRLEKIDLPAYRID